MMSTRAGHIVCGGKLLKVGDSGDVEFGLSDLMSTDIVLRVKELIRREFSGRADGRIVPGLAAYRQGITLEAAREVPGKRRGQTLYDFLLDLNFKIIGDRALQLAFRKQGYENDASRRSFVVQMYFKIMDDLTEDLVLNDLTPPQLGRVVYFIIKQLMDDADPHSDYDARTVAAFDKIYPGLEAKSREAGLGTVELGANQRWQGVMFKSFIYSALSGATDITFFGMEKPVRQVANDLGIAIPVALDFSSEEVVSTFLDQLAENSSYQDEILPWSTLDIIPIKLLKLMIRIVETSPEQKVVGFEAFDAWLDLIMTRSGQPIILRVDDKEDFVVVQLKLKAMLEVGFMVVVVGSDRPVMNDATANWLYERLSSDDFFRGYLSTGMLGVNSTGAGTGGTDLANTSADFNELVVDSSSIISEGSTNRESLFQDPPIAKPVITALMTGKDGIKVEFIYNP